MAAAAHEAAGSQTSSTDYLTSSPECSLAGLIPSARSVAAHAATSVRVALVGQLIAMPIDTSKIALTGLLTLIPPSINDFLSLSAAADTQPGHDGLKEVNCLDTSHRPNLVGLVVGIVVCSLTD